MQRADSLENESYPDPGKDWGQKEKEQQRMNG